MMTLALLLAAPLLRADVFDGEELADPTRPLVINQVRVGGGAVADIVSRLPATSFEVTFVRAGSSSPMAVVNNQRVTLGDVVGGATVIAIDRSAVTLSIDDEERRVSLFATNVKSAPAADN